MVRDAVQTLVRALTDKTRTDLIANAQTNDWDKKLQKKIAEGRNSAFSHRKHSQTVMGSEKNKLLLPYEKMMMTGKPSLPAINKHYSQNNSPRDTGAVTIFTETNTKVVTPTELVRGFQQNQIFLQKLHDIAGVIE